MEALRIGSAAALRASTPTSDKAWLAPGFVEGQGQDRDERDFRVEAHATQDVRGFDGEHKAFATLQARFALLGFQLLELADGTFLVARWNLSRVLPDLQATAQLLRQMGGAR